MECVATSMPAIIAGETIQCPGISNQEFKQKVTPGKTLIWGGGIKNHLCPQNNNPLFPKDQNKMPTPINADQLESYLDGYDDKKKQYLAMVFHWNIRALETLFLSKSKICHRQSKSH